MTISLKSVPISWGAFLFIFIFQFSLADAQVTEQQFQSTNDSLKSFFKKIQEHPALTDEVNATNEKIISSLENFLKQKDAFEFRFELDKNLSDLVAADNKVRIISWILPPSYGVYRCFGFVLIKNPATKATTVFRLNESEEKPEKPESKAFNYNNWQSCVYYNIITKKYKGKSFYTLLGWSGNDGITNKKIIDVLTISQKGEPVFGAPVFQMRKQKLYRIIFEYNAQAIMFHNYDEKKKMILFDHLSPSDPAMTGRFQYYGPDFSVDGLLFKKGLWILQEDVDAKNKN